MTDAKDVLLDHEPDASELKKIEKNIAQRRDEAPEFFAGVESLLIKHTQRTNVRKRHSQFEDGVGL